MRYRHRLLFMVTPLASWPSVATAATAISSPNAEVSGTSAENIQDLNTSAPQDTDSGWHFSASPYFWMAGLKGHLGVSTAVEPVAVDLSFGTILKHLKFAAMGSFEGRKGRIVLSGDMLFLKLKASDDIEIREVDFLDAELGSTTFMTTFTAGYRAVDQDRLHLDVFAGGRINSMKTALDLTGPNRSFSGSKRETWIDPVVGLRFDAPLGPGWSLRTYGDIGLGVSSDSTWQLLGLIQYDLGKHWSLSGGWRHLKTDYDQDGFVFDAAMDGPILNATYRF